jgi:hypothetical protein
MWQRQEMFAFPDLTQVAEYQEHKTGEIEGFITSCDSNLDTIPRYSISGPLQGSLAASAASGLSDCQRNPDVNQLSDSESVTQSSSTIAGSLKLGHDTLPPTAVCSPFPDVTLMSDHINLAQPFLSPCHAWCL